MKPLTPFEQQRLENIKNNQELLKTLGIGEADAKIGDPPPTPPPTKPRTKKKKVVKRSSSSTPGPVQPARRSSRSTANKPTTSYLEIGQDGNPLNRDKKPLKKLTNFSKERIDLQPRESSRRIRGKAKGSDGDSARATGSGSNGLYQDWDTEDEDDVSYDASGYKVLATPESKPGLKRKLVDSSPSSSRKSRKSSPTSSPSNTASSNDTSDVGIENGVSDWIISTNAPLPEREQLREGQGNGVLLFGRGFEAFRPNLTPEEMLRGGMQGGIAFRSHYSSVLDRVLSPAEDMAKFPNAWFEGLDEETQLAGETYDPKKNRFGVKAGQTLRDWEAAGWINAMDPRGWWQWYFEFYRGRRTIDDDRQISRWLKACGPAGRFKRSLVQEIHRIDAQWNDESVKPVVRQTLWHWGYELNQPDWEAYLP